MTYHYYVKLSLPEFVEKYKIHPVKEFLNIENETQDLELYANNSQMIIKITENIEKKLKLCSEFLYNDFIYLPRCICLLSKQPYSNQMEKCLETILKISYDKNFSSDDLNKIILHLIKEVPIPPANKRLMFYIPYMTGPIEIFGSLYKDLPCLNYHLKILLDKFSIENIILIHHLMLCEQKFLFIGESYFILTEVIEGFIALLYPLQ